MKSDSNFRILIVDDEDEYRDILKRILEINAYDADTAVSGQDALVKIKKDEYDLVLSDLIMPGMDGVELLGEIKKIKKDIEVILVTGYGSIENAVEAMRKGAFSYFVKGNAPEELLGEIEKVRESAALQNKMKQHISDSLGGEFLLGTRSEKFKKALQTAEKAAKSNITILLLGESGVGKEVFAKYIHSCSERKDKSFVAVNCCAFSESLLESELFGHEKGAFTGATDSRKGRFEAADKGTLFLDEIGDVSLDIQVKLLRVLETRKIEKIGSNVPAPVDFRLICATNKDLQQEMVEGRIREDFFYRISSIVITIPPLRERREDLPDLIEFFLGKAQLEMGKEITSVQKEVMSFLLSYDYPGNIRELRNILNRLVVLSENGVLRASDLPNVENQADVLCEYDVRPLRDIRRDFESEYIERVLEVCGNNVSKAAKLLDISRRQLTKKIAEFGLREASQPSEMVD